MSYEVYKFTSILNWNVQNGERGRKDLPTASGSIFLLLHDKQNGWFIAVLCTEKGHDDFPKSEVGRKRTPSYQLSTHQAPTYNRSTWETKHTQERAYQNIYRSNKRICVHVSLSLSLYLSIYIYICLIAEYIKVVVRGRPPSANACCPVLHFVAGSTDWPLAADSVVSNDITTFCEKSVFSSIASSLPVCYVFHVAAIRLGHTFCGVFCGMYSCLLTAVVATKASTTTKTSLSDLWFTLRKLLTYITGGFCCSALLTPSVKFVRLTNNNEYSSAKKKSGLAFNYTTYILKRGFYMTM